MQGRGVPSLVGKRTAQCLFSGQLLGWIFSGVDTQALGIGDAGERQIFRISEVSHDLPVQQT